MTATSYAPENVAYYGQPIIKPPTWTDLIPTYFFAGGLAGAAGLLGLTARLQGNRQLERALDITTMAAIGVSAFCLIKDLGKPMRFINMLRVFKPTSPMSMGTYIFSAFSTSAALGFVGDLVGMDALALPCKIAAAAVGPVLSTYTAVLISDTAVPAWHESRKTMPALFAAGSAMSAAGAGLAFGPAQGAMCVNLAVGAAIVEILTLQQHHRELGPKQSKAYETGKAKTYMTLARSLTVAGALLARPQRRVAGIALLAAAFLERFGVMEAGRNSAKDPSYVLAQQLPEG
jgi:formate-dependent nitrite reductase membrane component NrfD